ncbi:MAG: acetate--CoA ligase alpha subunit [bacterium]
MNHSLDAIFSPKSVAVIGASTQKGVLGREIFDKLINNEFNGPVYPVNPKAQYIHSVKAYPSIYDVPDQVDLAILVVRSEFVLQIIQECSECGVKGIIVISAGFKETGEKGSELERKILEIIRSHGMRMIGPNCMGVINTDPEVRLDATFASTVPLRGNIGFVSQSGALGQTILEHTQALNLGVSMFVSVGNKADVSGNDLLEYWCDDPSVEVILMYLESFGNPRKFIQLAKEVSLKKPIVVVKSGRTTSGARAAFSHTGALAGTDMAFDALFKQCGVIRADTIEEMFDIALGLANLPLPKGNRVAIITNAGGPAIMAADTCENIGLEVAKLAEKTKEKLREYLVPEASVNNPVDLLAAGGPEDFQFALKQVLQDENVDSAIVIFVAPIITDPSQVAQKISQVADKFDKPVMGCFMGVKGVATGVEELQRHRIPTYSFPESAVRALASMVKYNHWLKKDLGTISTFQVNNEKVKSIIEDAINQKREYLANEEISEIMQSYGIPFIQSKECKNLEEILQVSKDMRSPFVLKVSSEEVIHKTEAGGVKIDLHTEKDVQAAYTEMVELFKAKGISLGAISFTLQEMLEGGRETIMGLHSIRNFGSLIMFGLGGIYVEVLQDVSFRISPLSDTDVDEMIKEIRGFPILQGIRGERPVALNLIREVLLRLSQLAQDFPQIKELDINPFLVFPEKEKCKGVDARIRVASANQWVE